MNALLLNRIFPMGIVHIIGCFCSAIRMEEWQGHALSEQRNEPCIKASGMGVGEG